MNLYLLRHGVAVPHGAPDVLDDDRPLTPEGERRARSVGRALKRLKVKPEMIATSPLPRALRTAEIVAEVLGRVNRIELVDHLRAGQDAGVVEDWVRTRSEPSLMVVGHNPTLSDLLTRLVIGPDQPTFCELRKGGVAALRSDEGQHFRVDWIARPKLFRS